MFIITRAINQYDQDGEYFETAFINKPTINQLIEFGFNKITAKHLLNGGGRTKEMEETWYYLTEIKEGEQYQSYMS